MNPTGWLLQTALGSFAGEATDPTDRPARKWYYKVDAWFWHGI